MNTKLLKGILLYTLVVIGIVLIIGMLIFGIMFFVPSFKPFGVGAIWSRQKEVDWGKNGEYISFITTNADGGDLDLKSGVSAFYSDSKNAKVATYDFNIISQDISVEIQANDQDKQGRVAFLNNTFGLYKGDYNLKVTYEDVVVGSKHVFTITATQPEGFLSVKNSKVVLEVPTTFAYNFRITTQKGNVYLNLDNSKPLYIESLYVTTTKGDLKVGNVTQKQDNYTNYFGTFSGNIAEFQHFYAATDSGDLDFSNIDNLAIIDRASNNTTTISANKGNIRFKNLMSEAPIKVDGDNIRLMADNIYTSEISCVVTNGYFNVGNIILEKTWFDKGYVMISTSNAEVNIDNIMGTKTPTSAIITTTYGNVNIKDTITGSAKVSSTHGNIKINDIKGNVSAQSKYGDISINYEGSCSVYNDHGDINITYVRSQESADKFVDVTSLRGKVNINNQVYNLNVTGQRNAEINVTFAKLYIMPDGTTRKPTTHNITANGRSVINVNIPNLEYSAKFSYAPYSIDQEQAYSQNNIICNLGNDKQFAYEGLQYPYNNQTNENAPAQFNIDARGNGSRVSLNAYDKNALLPESTNVFKFDVWTTNSNHQVDQFVKEFSYYQNDDIFAWKGDNFVVSKYSYKLDNTSWIANIFTLTYTISDVETTADTQYEVRFKSSALTFGRFVRDDNGNYFKGDGVNSPEYIHGSTTAGQTEKYRFERFELNTLYLPNQIGTTLNLYAVDENNGGQIAFVVRLTLQAAN